MANVFLYLGKLFLKIAAEKMLGKSLSTIYEKLDYNIPVALFNGASPFVIRSEIQHTVASVTKQAASKEMIDLIAAVYDPIENANRTQRRQR